MLSSGLSTTGLKLKGKTMKLLATAAAVLLATVSFVQPNPARADIPAVMTGHNGQMPTLAPMVKHVEPAIVSIQSRGHEKVQQNPMFNDPFFRQFFGRQFQQPRERQFAALGSGVIVNAKKGYILTNNHVVAPSGKHLKAAQQITVALKDGRTLTGKVLGRDPKTDIAVVKVKAKNLTQIKLGNSSKLQPGDFVVAVGNPFGLTETVTSGIVSALGRSQIPVQGEGQGTLTNFIQTDAAINPGNSGGALVNLKGQVVGINTAILSGSGGNIGIGFAIPINMAKQVMHQIIKYGKVEHGELGVYIQPLTPKLAKALGVSTKAGAVISQVISGSPAQKAGLKQGDVVTAVDGHNVTSATDLQSAILLKRPGNTVTLDVLRNGKHHKIKATLGNANALEQQQQGSAGGGKAHPGLHGLQIGKLNQRSPLYGKVKGVLVTGVDPGSEASQSGIRPGDVIIAVNRRPVRGVAQFRQAVKQNKGNLLLTVHRSSGGNFFAVLR
jgi:Do/DeqQ family serine protease